MKTYLFTWNPTRFEFTDIEDLIEEIIEFGNAPLRWSSGNNKSIKIGDRIFLMRLGEEPKGIVASGYVTSNHIIDEHWEDPEKTANFNDIEFDVLLNSEVDDIFYLDEIQEIFPNFKWTPQSSGINIPDEIATKLEEIWFNFLNQDGLLSDFYNKTIEIDDSESYIEGKSTTLSITRYERNPHARKKCIEHFGYNCQVCDMNFEEKYGKIGKEFIHVHHLQAIAERNEIYELNPKTDLVPVCPNCHAMIHKKNPSYKIEEMKNMIEN